MTLIGDCKADQTSKGDAQYYINLLSKVTVHQKIQCRDYKTLSTEEETSLTPKRDNVSRLPVEKATRLSIKHMTDIYHQSRKIARLFVETEVLLLIETGFRIDSSRRPKKQRVWTLVRQTDDLES